MVLDFCALQKWLFCEKAYFLFISLNSQCDMEVFCVSMTFLVAAIYEALGFDFSLSVLANLISK